MLDVLRGVMYVVWSGVGITIIAGTIYSLTFYRRFYKGLFTDKGEA